MTTITAIRGVLENYLAPHILVNDKSGRVALSARKILNPRRHDDTKEEIEKLNTQNQILNGGDGVTFNKFNNWMESFMTNGSDVKIAFASPVSHAAMSIFMSSKTNGYRLVSDNDMDQNIPIRTSTFQTPWGYIDLCSDRTEQPGDVTVLDIAAIGTQSEFYGSAIAEHLCRIVA